MSPPAGCLTCAAPYGTVNMINVFLHGRLKALLPAPGPMRLEVSSPAEAVRALCALRPGAREVLSEGQWRIAAGAEPVALDTLGLALGTRPALHIHPHAAAAGSESSAPGAALCGLSLLGSAYALTSIPEIGDYGAREDTHRRAPYRYRGPANATAQGGRVPVIYGGPIRVGSTVVSAGTDSERIQLTEPDDADPDERCPDSGGGMDAGGGGSAEPGRHIAGDVTLQTRATLRAVDLIGEGPLCGLVDGLKSVFIDGTPVENADGTRNVGGFHLCWRAGTPDQKPPEGIPEVSESQQFDEIKVADGSPVTRTVQSKRDSARVTLRFPRLETITEGGDGLGASVEFTIEVQPSGGDFKTVIGPQTISDRSIAPADISWRMPLDGDAPHTVRVTRLSEDATSDRVHNDLYWVGLDEITEVRQSYPHTALVGIEAEADKFSGAEHKREYEIYGRIVDVPSNYDPETRTYTEPWDGTFKQAWTDNGAWCVFDMLRSTRYGLGGDIDADRLSATKWDLYEIARSNDRMVDDGAGGTEPRYRFTGVIASAADARRVLADMLSNFRASHYHGGDSIVPFRDAPKAPDEPEEAVALLGPANVEGGTFDYGEAVAHSERFSAVAVSFLDPYDGYKPGIDLVADDALVARYGYRQRDIAAMYCTSRAQAHRHGRHLLVEQELESDTVCYRAGLDQASIGPGRVVRIGDPLVAGDRAGCRLLGVISTDTDTIYRLAGTVPDAPAGGEDTHEHTPQNWTREQPVATVTESVWSAERTRTFFNDAFRSASAWDRVTEVDDPIAATTDSDTIYRLAANRPADPVGGGSVEAHTPADWTRQRPRPTPTESVWSAERTRTFHDSAFYSATVWSNVTEADPALTGTREIALPPGTLGAGAWEGAVFLDPALIADAAVAYLRHFSNAAGNVRVRLAATEDGDPTAPGPEFTPEFETADSAFVFSDGTSSITLKGPNHPDNAVLDAAEPYLWLPDNRADFNAWIIARQSQEVTLTLTLPDRSNSDS